MGHVEDDIRRLKDATRAAHEATKDLKAAVREAKEAKENLIAEVTKMMDTGVAGVVEAGLESYTATVGRAMDVAVARVFNKFDQLSDMLMGTDKSTRRRGEPTLEELIADLAAARAAEAEMQDPPDTSWATTASVRSKEASQLPGFD